MSVSVDAHDGTGTTFNATATPWSYTGLTTTAAATAILVEIVNNEQKAISLDSIVSVKWDTAGANQSFSLISGTTSATITGGTNKFATVLYGLASPNSFGNKTIQINWTASTTPTGYVAAMSFAGTDTTTPFHNGTTATSSVSAAQSITITSPSGEFAAAVFTDDAQAYTSVSNSQNMLDNGGANGNAAANYVAGSGSTTLTASPNDIFASSGVSVQPPAGGDVLAASPGIRWI